ncbi:hypothetical protein QQF64_022090 [Cirrhinus molitorella]|uniref:Uncharacterized protein n=1 Tax=Cirrhinus molitorella TaxID=172907 RepID=A0ABR3LAU2_9TELE
MTRDDWQRLSLPRRGLVVSALRSACERRESVKRSGGSSVCGFGNDALNLPPHSYSQNPSRNTKQHLHCD